MNRTYCTNVARVYHEFYGPKTTASIVHRLPKTSALFFAGLQLPLCKLLYFTRFFEWRRIINMRYRSKILSLKM
jgi:hypothetical protein